jgi:hypothetical protein
MGIFPDRYLKTTFLKEVDMLIDSVNRMTLLILDKTRSLKLVVVRFVHVVTPKSAIAGTKLALGIFFLLISALIAAAVPPLDFSSSPYTRVVSTFVTAIFGTIIIAWDSYDSASIFWWRWTDLAWILVAVATLLTQAIGIERERSRSLTESERSEMLLEYKELTDSAFDVDVACDAFSVTEPNSNLPEGSRIAYHRDPSSILVSETAIWKAVQDNANQLLQWNAKKYPSLIDNDNLFWIRNTYTGCAIWDAVFTSTFHIHFSRRGPIAFEFPQNWFEVSTDYEGERVVWGPAGPSVLPNLIPIRAELRGIFPHTDERTSRDIALILWSCTQFPVNEQLKESDVIFKKEAEVEKESVDKAIIANYRRNKLCKAVTSYLNSIRNYISAKERAQGFDERAMFGLAASSRFGAWFSAVAFFAAFRLGRTIAEIRADFHKLSAH